MSRKQAFSKANVFILILAILMFVSSCTPIGQGTAAQDGGTEGGYADDPSEGPIG